MHAELKTAFAIMGQWLELEIISDTRYLVGSEELILFAIATAESGCNQLRCLL
jgi:hypothetical protein